MNITARLIEHEPSVLVEADCLNSQMSRSDAIELRNALNAALGDTAMVRCVISPEAQAVLDAAKVWARDYWLLGPSLQRESARARASLFDAVKKLDPTVSKVAF